jgi:hypothetical protein
VLKIHATAQRKFERNGDSYSIVNYSFPLMEYENRVNVSPAELNKFLIILFSLQKMFDLYIIVSGKRIRFVRTKCKNRNSCEG